MTVCPHTRPSPRQTAPAIIVAVVGLAAALTATAPTADAAPEIEILSPARSGLVAEVPTIAVEVAAAGLAKVQVSVAGSIVQATRSGESFLAWQVPLRAGDNKLVVQATRDDGRGLSTAVIVRSATKPQKLALAATPAFVEGLEGASELRIHTTLDPARLGVTLVDTDGDGVLEQRAPFASTTQASYDAPGQYAARVAVRDKETGLLLCTRSTASSRVRVVPPSDRVTDAGFAGIGPSVRDVEYDPYSRRVYTLCSRDKKVRAYRADGELAEEIVLPDVHDPRGIGLDRHGNLYVADAGAHRILKLVASDGWAPDKRLGRGGRGTFGLRGDAAGMLQGPLDVCVEPGGEEPRIVVCDTGNHRIQMFTPRGVLDRMIDGSGSPDGPMNAPQSVAMTAQGAIVVADRGNSLVRLFSVGGEQVLAFGGAGDAPGQFKRLAKISLDERTHGFVVADPGNLRVHLFDGNGHLRRVQSVASPGVEAAVLDHAPTVSRWILARSASSALDVYHLHADPPGQGPVDAARTFLEALRSGDTDTARAQMLPHRATRLMRDLSVPARRSRLEMLAAAVDTLTLVRVPAADVAMTRVRVERDGATKDVDIELVRSRATGKWRVLGY